MNEIIIKDLKEHMLATYHCLRYGIGILGIAFPSVFMGSALSPNIELQHSLSAYYCKGGTVILMNSLIVLDMGDVFVGILCSVGFGLILYRGFTCFENWALNIAGLFVILAALIPTLACVPSDNGINCHLICAGLFFLFHAYVCIFRASDTLSLMPDETWKKIYRIIYRSIGIVMVIAISVIPFLARTTKGIIIPQAIAVGVFGLYWIVKAVELKKSSEVHKHLIKDGLEIQYRRSEIFKLQICVKPKGENFKPVPERVT